MTIHVTCKHCDSESTTRAGVDYLLFKVTRNNTPITVQISYTFTPTPQ